MKSADPQWNQICAEYIAKVEKALQGAAAPERRQILDEVAVHLKKRFEELNPDELTWEKMQTIIIEMGPPEEYAELLEEKSAISKPTSTKSVIFWIVGSLAMILLLSYFGISHYLLNKLRQDARRPVVIKTSPETLSNTVDPETAEISVTFDQPMMNFSWSWVGGGEHYPETTGEPRYNSERTTCTLPVKLKPGQWYWIGINSEYYVYFQTEKHIAAEPYVILFATADENGHPTEIPEDYVNEAKRVNSQ